MGREQRTYILYDDRAADGMGTDDASVLVACDDNQEALSYRGDYGGMACYSYRVDGNQLVDERFEWNWFPGMNRRTRKRGGKKRRARFGKEI